MAISRRHHYLPQFYLKGFSNQEGKFAVFDKKRKVLKNGYYSPKSHFFEKDRNTFTIEGEETDFLENLYSDYDNRLSDLFEKFQRDDEESDILNPYNIQELKLFIAMMFWRVPESDQLVDTFFESFSFDELGIKLEDQDGNSAPDSVKQKMFEDPNFRQACRFLILPLNTFQITLQDSDINNWKYYYTESDFHHLCGDQPIVFKNPKSLFIFEDDLFLPLTKNKFLVYTKKEKVKELPPEFALLRDILIFGQSRKYVCSSSRDYLKVVSNLYYNRYANNDLHKLRKEVFSYLN